MRVGEPDPLMRLRYSASFRHERVRCVVITLAISYAPCSSRVDAGLAPVHRVSCSVRSDLKDEVTVRCT